MPTRREVLASLVALGIAPATLLDTDVRERAMLALGDPKRALQKQYGMTLDVDKDFIGGVYLMFDGESLADCHAASEKEGWARCYLTDGSGQVLFDKENKELNSVTIYGDVKFINSHWLTTEQEDALKKMRYLYADNGVLKLSEPL